MSFEFEFSGVKKTISGIPLNLMRMLFIFLILIKLKYSHSHSTIVQYNNIIIYRTLTFN